MYCNVGVIYYNAAEVHGLSGKSALFSIVIIAMSRWITRVIFFLEKRQIFTYCSNCFDGGYPFTPKRWSCNCRENLFREIFLRAINFLHLLNNWSLHRFFVFFLRSLHYFRAITGEEGRSKRNGIFHKNA